MTESFGFNVVIRSFFTQNAEQKTSYKKLECIVIVEAILKLL